MTLKNTLVEPVTELDTMTELLLRQEMSFLSKEQEKVVLFFYAQLFFESTHPPVVLVGAFTVGLHRRLFLWLFDLEHRKSWFLQEDPQIRPGEDGEMQVFLSEELIEGILEEEDRLRVIGWHDTVLITNCPFTGRRGRFVL